jgi:beta-1,2-mannobiose phosphorylase / 1,2-beta-oligomannan phosphorylase
VIAQEDRPTRLAGELFVRHQDNPILTADDWPYRVNVVFNPGAAVVDGETVLLARVEARTGISHLTVARSPNGIDGWTISSEPLLAPNTAEETELWGFEDARTVWIEELERFAITCTAYGPAGPAVYLATTRDFRSVERHGIVKRAEDKNAALLPVRIDGKWILFHRPMNAFGGSRGAIFLSRSDDLVSWSLPEPVLKPRHGAWWDSLRIGIGPPLVKTDEGWLLIYHGVKETVAGCIYRVGLAMLDLDEPTRVLRRCHDWVFGPSAPYEREGDVPNAVFPCGLVVDEASGAVRLYYGAADTSICLATARLDELVAAVMSSPS